MMPSLVWNYNITGCYYIDSDLTSCPNKKCKHILLVSFSEDILRKIYEMTAYGSKSFQFKIAEMLAVTSNAKFIEQKAIIQDPNFLWHI